MPENGVSTSVVRFTPEELFVLLDELKSRGLPELDREAFADLPSEQKMLALDVARRGLVARGLAEAQADGTLKLSQVALAALSPALAAEESFLVMTIRAGRLRQSGIFHSAGDRFVLHVAPRRPADLNIHTFQILPDRDAVKEAALDLLLPQEIQTPNLPPLYLPVRQFDRAARLVQSGEADQAQAALLEMAGTTPPGESPPGETHSNENDQSPVEPTRQWTLAVEVQVPVTGGQAAPGSSADTAAAVAAALAGEREYRFLAALPASETQSEAGSPKQPQPEQDFSVLITSETAWLLEPSIENGEEWVCVRPAARRSVRRHLDKYI